MYPKNSKKTIESVLQTSEPGHIREFCRTALTIQKLFKIVWTTEDDRNQVNQTNKTLYFPQGLINNEFKY